jgi:O-antigen ligase/tetratricopeptide (TPR) repeat protein
VLLLLLVPPLAFGAVHPWAFSLLEIVIFLLLLVWVLQLLVTRLQHDGAGERIYPARALRSLLIPLLLFVGLVLFQLCPLPPAVLRVISPATYSFYAHLLPGWPHQLLYDKAVATRADSEEPEDWVVLPTPQEVGQGTPVPFSSGSSEANDAPLISSDAPITWNSWKPLSLAPPLTQIDLVKFLAYTALFCLTLSYPFGWAEQRRGREREERFVQRVLLTILCSGLLVAVVGIIQCFTWNGKILWAFVPYDWGAPHPDVPLRAQGPFVNSSHFANYLAMIFPLAVVATCFRTILSRQGLYRVLRPVWGVTSFFVGVGILLSASRGGWIGLILGLGVVLWGIASERKTTEKSDRLLPWFFSFRVVLASATVVLLLALSLVGASARRQMDARLDETLQGEVSGRTRVAIWADTGKMIQDFPLWGVGLGAWASAFPHYQRPMWSGVYFREAHNDYVELAAETGIVGCALLAWFFASVAARLWRGGQVVSARGRPVFIAVVGAVGVMAVHEVVDFNLQIPANAVLFTVLLGIALRITAGEERPSLSREMNRRVPLALAVGGSACGLIVLALHQESLPYPYNLPIPTSWSEAKALLQEYPTHPPFHLTVAQLLPETAPLSYRQSALEAALWLDPSNAQARDFYAVTLLRQGKKEEGLAQTTLSIFYAPTAAAHTYLRSRIIPWLPREEQTAIEDGFRRALAAGSREATTGLGEFYASLGRFLDQGAVYEEVARREPQEQRKVSWLFQAAQAYSQAKEGEKVEQMLRTVITLMPREERAYQQLAEHWLVTRKSLDAAKVVLREGIENGADAFLLFLAFADSARAVENMEEAKIALSQALTIRPESFAAHTRLGQLYLQERNFDRAALVWRKATDLDPQAASAFYHLGLAEKGRYRFLEAEKALARALTLQPNEPTFQHEYEALRKMKENRTSSVPFSNYPVCVG